MGQSIATGDAAPARTIRYTLDLTRQYHNLLQKTGNNQEQTYFWDAMLPEWKKKEETTSTSRMT